MRKIGSLLALALAASALVGCSEKKNTSSTAELLQKYPQRSLRVETVYVPTGYSRRLEAVDTYRWE